MLSYAYIVQTLRPLLFASWMSLMSLAIVLVVKSDVSEDMYEACFLCSSVYGLTQARLEH